MTQHRSPAVPFRRGGLDMRCSARRRIEAPDRCVGSKRQIEAPDRSAGSKHRIDASADASNR